MHNHRKVSVVVVTHQSQKVISRCLAALAAQTRRPDRIVVVDSNSPDCGYLDDIGPEVELIRCDTNIGFCRANNIGVRACADSEYILFLNPDAFLSTTFLAGAVDWMDAPENSGVGIMTGILLGFDVAIGRASNRIDSTGIFQTWYGRWYDRDQGVLLEEATPRVAVSDLPAACGALMFCRHKALADALLRGEEVFDETFYMYKEDIDLSIRVARRGWRVTFVPEFACWHGRGWSDRRKVAAWAKKISARNEIRICLRNGGKGLIFSLAKYVYVHTVEPLFR
jgi:N-acetylglucosaminyl-diphospho-decaprenol L-rhamnosyltransferase